MAPNSQMMAKQDRMTKKAAETYRAMDRALRPDPEQKLTLNTRFGRTPGHKDTFGNFKHCPGSAGHLSENQRFRKTHSVGIKCYFQQEDKARKDRYTAGRLKRRGDRIRTIESQAQANDLKVDMFDQQKIARKSGVLARYERISH